MSARRSAASMLALTVTAEGDHVGEVTGFFADSGCERIFGLEVTTPEGSSKFLPWVAAHVAGGTVTADSALVLIDLAELDGYAHRGARVYRDRGALRSVLIGRDGSVAHQRAGFGSACRGYAHEVIDLVQEAAARRASR